MGFGWGFLKQMNDTLKYNRDLLGSRKSARDAIKDEILQRGASYENVDIEELKARVEAKLKRNKKRERLARITATVVTIATAIGLIWVLAGTRDVQKKDKYADKRLLFNTVIYKKTANTELRVDYYKRGTKAAETNLKNGLRHQNTESYYETGEQFRAALLQGHAGDGNLLL